MAQNQQQDPDLAQRPPNRTSISITASKLAADMSITKLTRNTEPLINSVVLDVAVIIRFFQSIVEPFVELIHPLLGVRDPDLDVNGILDSTTYTIAVDALSATYAVMYHKATRINARSAFLFGHPPRTDKFTSINLISFFANAFGPYETEGPPYRCIYVPYFTRDEIDNAITDNRYNQRLAIHFLDTIKTSYPNIELTMIDPYTEPSSPFWMMYATTNGPNLRTVYSPITYNEIDSASQLASILLDQPMYNIPGPLTTAVIGPYVAKGDTFNSNQIPDNLLTPVSRNTSRPVIHITGRKIRNALWYEMLTHSTNQNDQEMRNAIPACIRHPNTWMTQQLTPLDDYISQSEKIITGQLPTPTKPEPGEVTPKKKKGEKHPKLPPKPVYPTGTSPMDSCPHYSVFNATILYFDHILIERFPVSRRTQIVRDAVATTPPPHRG
jgi:hypothetical protein